MEHFHYWGVEQAVRARRQLWRDVSYVQKS
jgi:hypothetical protein